MYTFIHWDSNIFFDTRFKQEYLYLHKQSLQNAYQKNCSKSFGIFKEFTCGKFLAWP